MWISALRASSGRLTIAAMLLMGFLNSSLAGPPYRTDDPEPTDYGHYEIYAFTNGIVAEDGTSGASGIDFNYGGAPNLQLTATLPVGYTFSDGGAFLGGLSNIELAAKYRFLTQANFGLDVAVFPRLFLPSASSNIGESHASLSLAVMGRKGLGQMVGLRWWRLRNQSRRKLPRLLSHWLGDNQPGHFQIAGRFRNLPSNVGHSGWLSNNIPWYRRSLRFERALSSARLSWPRHRECPGQ
jgi:hypothetical protein